MHDLTSFESRLSERLAVEFGSEVAFDATAIASAAMTRRGVRANVMNRLGLADGMRSVRSNRAAQLAVVALLLAMVAAIALGVGRLLDRPSTLPEPRLAYINAPGDLFLANSDGANASMLIAGNGPNELGQERVGFSDVMWAPGGGHLLATQATPRGSVDLVILDRTGHVTVRRDIRVPCQYLWSPDGRQVAVLSGADVTGQLTDPPSFVQLGLLDVRLDLIAADGSGITSVTLPAEFSFAIDSRAIAWSPGGRRIALAGVIATGTTEGVESHIWLVDPADGAAEQVTSDPSAFDDAPAWSGDGHLYFARRDPSGHAVWRADGTGRGQERLAAWDGWVDAILPSRDSSRLAVLNRPFDTRAEGSAVIQQPRIAVLDLATGAVTELLPPGKTSFGSSIAWGPDDASVIWMDSSLNPLAELTQTTVATGSVRVLASRIVSFDLTEAAR